MERSRRSIIKLAASIHTPLRAFEPLPSNMVLFYRPQAVDIPRSTMTEVIRVEAVGENKDRLIGSMRIDPDSIVELSNILHFRRYRHL